MATLLLDDHAVLASLAEGRLPRGELRAEQVSPELRALVEQLREVQAVALALGRGELTLPPDLRGRGPVIGSLKALHAALRHLGWQARRVAEGDLSQRVDFMGEFADAFNEMVAQLAARRELEERLRRAQRLEAIGRLATGLAHEMNTPAQFVSADLDFLSEACDALLGLIGAYREAIAEAAMGPLSSGTLASLAGREASAGLDFLAAEAPAAARSAARGVARIAEIVAAMKEFAGSPGQGAAAADLNRVVRATLIVAEGQCRDIAAVQYSLGELPEVRCRASEVAEVLLGLFANAVEAIDAAGRRGAGLLRVSTQADGGGARVDVADNGCGIPDSLAARLFDSPGRARDAERGQTLGAARAVIVEGHGGRLWFDTRVGEGSTFHVWLPFEPPAAQSVEA